MKNNSGIFRTQNSVKWAILSTLLLVLAVPCKSFAAGENLIENGDFEKGTDWPDGWGKPRGTATLEKKGENHFVRLVADKPGEENTLYVAIPIESGKAYELTYRVNVEKIVPGKQLWFDARIITNIKDASGENFPSPGPVYFRKDSGKWVEKSIKFKAPENATKFEIIAGLFQVEAGIMELDDLVLKEIDPKSVK